MAWRPFVVVALVFLVSIDFACSDIALDFTRIRSVVRVSFGYEVVQTATQGPNVNFFVEHMLGAVLEDFWGTIVQMSREAFVLQKFLEVVRHTYHVELDYFVSNVDPCRMNIPEDQSSRVDVLQSQSQLPEN